MAFTEHDRAAAADLLRRLSAHNDELLKRGLARLTELGSNGSPAPPDRFWPTTTALLTWHQQQKRSIGAGMGALDRLTRRAGANGTNRYPQSEWGDPLAQLPWMTRARGRPGVVDVPQNGSAGGANQGAGGEVCPHCGSARLTHSTRAKEFGRGHERTFGHCPRCDLVVDETPVGEPDEPAGVVEGAPERAGSRERETAREQSATGSPPDASRTPAVPPALPPALRPAARPSGEPYFDEAGREWFRRMGEGHVPLLVAGADDRSAPQKGEAEECWACANTPHSVGYHIKQIAEGLARRRVQRVSDAGTVRVVHEDESALFYDETAQ